VNKELTAWGPLAVEFGRAVKRLRMEAGLSGAALAALAGITQPTVSKIELGRIVARPETAGRLLDVLGAAGLDRARLLELLEGALIEARTRQRRESGAAMRDAVVARERAATMVRGFYPTLVPVLLQTIDYTERVGGLAPWLMGPETGLDFLAAHTERQSVLYRPGRMFEFVFTEAALREGLVDRPAARGQIDRLASLTTVPNVTIGVIPRDVLLPLVPWNGFTLFDDAAVAVATFVGETISSEPGEVETYVRAFAELRSAAHFGANAIAALHRVSGELVP
jgi:transcriptional regulator with XRE-family HTH domain